MRGSLRLAVRWGLLLGLLVAASGCPRDLETPPRGEGRACVELADCNPRQECGLLTACVDERCEAQPTVVAPCPGGDPVFLPDAGR